MKVPIVEMKVTDAAIAAEGRGRGVQVVEESGAISPTRILSTATTGAEEDGGDVVAGAGSEIGEWSSVPNLCGQLPWRKRMVESSPLTAV